MLFYGIATFALMSAHRNVVCLRTHAHRSIRRSVVPDVTSTIGHSSSDPDHAGMYYRHYQCVCLALGICCSVLQIAANCV